MLTGGRRDRIPIRERIGSRETPEDTIEISGKTFAVTGGGNGIGRQVVLELLRRGALDSVAMNLATRIAPKQATHLIQRQMQDLLS